MSHYIYVVQAGEGAIKIGITNNVWTRLAGLQTGNPELLKLLYYLTCPSIEVAYRIESVLHKRYGTRRLAGEWFNVKPGRVLADIEFVRAISPYLDDVTLSYPGDDEPLEEVEDASAPTSDVRDKRLLRPEMIVNPFTSKIVQSDKKNNGTLDSNGTEGK